MAAPQHVPFVMVEDEDDWVVSFALGPQGADRLTLVRTPTSNSCCGPSSAAYQ